MRTPSAPPALLFLLAAAACGGDGGDDPDGPAASSAEAPTPYVYTPAEGTTPDDIDLVAVSSALQGALAEVRTLNAAPVLGVYQGLMAEADPQCPAYYEQDGNTFWYAYCTAESGAYYAGYAFYNLYTGMDLFGDGNAWDAEAVSGTADMTDASGAHHFHLGGSAYLAETVTADGARVWYSLAQGAFFADTPEAQGTWLEAGQAPAMTLYAIRYEELDLNAIFITGNAALSGAVTAISTDGLAMYSFIPGFTPCPEEPAGSLAFRDEVGRWYTVTFDVDPDTREVINGGTCDGCGTVRYQGEVLGEVCVDGAVMVNWEVTPW